MGVTRRRVGDERKLLTFKSQAFVLNVIFNTRNFGLCKISMQEWKDKVYRYFNSLRSRGESKLIACLLFLLYLRSLRATNLALELSRFAFFSFKIE